MDDRTKNIWVVVLGGLALVVAIAALVVAHDAKDQTKSNEQIADQVKTQIDEQIGNVQAELTDSSAAAKTANKQLNADLRQAKKARQALAAQQKKLDTQQSDTDAEIAKLQHQIKQQDNRIANINKRLDSLESESGN